MGTIRVEFVPIAKYNLGLFHLDHLQLVFEDESGFFNSQDYWYVMEGLHDGGIFNGSLGVLGEDGRLQLQTANDASKEDLVAKIGTPETRGTRIIKTGGDSLGTWSDMAQYATEIAEQQFPYLGASWPFGVYPTLNSTSFITTLLWTIGLDINYVMPFGVRNSPGTGTILGTTHNDNITTGGNLLTVAGGFGEDNLHGSDNLIYLDKLYGGDDNDTVYWSHGENIIHGGQFALPYAEDGLDTVDYSGVGQVHLISTKHAVEHKVANYIAAFEGGSDQLFSIEQVSWDKNSDYISAGEGVDVLERPLELKLKDQTNNGRGDQLDFSDSGTGLVINAAGGEFTSIQTASSSGQDAGYWADSAEWIIGSGSNDLIYTSPALLGADGGQGDDVIDGRLATPFSFASPLGYDVEISGDQGDDTLVSGAGYTFAKGGSGSDRFVLSTMSSDVDHIVEFVIDDATSDDQLFVPYNFFKQHIGEFENSQLFQLTGAPFKIDGTSVLQSYFTTHWTDYDQIHGNIEFSGQIVYEMSGADLLISLFEGSPEEFVIPADSDGPAQHWLLNLGNGDTETHIRVLNWSDGDLGISFPLTFNINDLAAAGSYDDLPGYNRAIDDQTSSARFQAPLDIRPDGYLPKAFQSNSLTSALVIGPAPPTQGDDTLTIAPDGPFKINGLGGNDTITGSDAADIIDGGTGADIMTGGKGNDFYYVDNVGDRVIEFAGGSFDDVYSSIDYVLPENVEHLTLTGMAIHGTGNNQRNTVVGNILDNVLDGGAGDDTIAGNEGADIMAGGAGSDGYVYGLGDGHDVIIDAGGSNADQDVLILSNGMKPSDVSFIRNPNSPDNLVLRFSDGGDITIKDYFLGHGAGIESLEFTGGPVWGATEFAARAAAAIVTDNAAPVALDDSYVYAGVGAFTVSAAALTDNDFDPDGNRLVIQSIANISQGTVTIDANGDLAITPGDPTASSIAFDYTVSDGRGGLATANAAFSLVTNHAPVISASAFGAVDPKTRTAAGSITASDDDGDGLIYALEAGSGPLKGTVTFGTGGAFTYQAFASASGADTFTVTVSDGLGGVARQTFNEIVPQGAPDKIGPPPTKGGIGGGSGGPGSVQGHTFIGTKHHDALAGTDGDDTFYGKRASDVLTGGGGNDVFLVRGDDGRDRIDGGSGYDIVRGSKGNDTIRVSDHLANLKSIEAIEGRGGHGDRIIATSHNDHLDFSKIKITGIERIDAGRGDDEIIGSHGRDILAGGAGSDTFIFSGSSGHDVILDFTIGVGLGLKGDVIDLKHTSISSYADLWNHISQSGQDALITLDSKNSLLLKGVDYHQLQFDNFKIG